MNWWNKLFAPSDLDAFDAALLARLEAEFNAEPDAFLAEAKRPSPTDFQLIGTFIQVYSFAEMTARQIVEMIDALTPGKSANAASRLAGHDVFPHLEAAANRLGQTGTGNLKETLLRAAGTVKMHRQMRHTLAHWAVRRVSGDDAFIFLSKNAQEGKKRTGNMIGESEISYGFTGKRTLRRELRKLEEHTQNLSVAAAKMTADRETLAKMVKAGSA